MGVSLRRNRRAKSGAHRRRPRSQCHLVPSASQVDPHENIVPVEHGIFVHVNGAGGHGHDETSGTFTGFLRPIRGTKPQVADDDNWCVTRIDLIGPRAADVSITSFGNQDPPDVIEPTPLHRFEVRF